MIEIGRTYCPFCFEKMGRFVEYTKRGLKGHIRRSHGAFRFPELPEAMRKVNEAVAIFDNNKRRGEKHGQQ